MSDELDYMGLLAFARKQAGREFEQSWPAMARLELEHIRKKLVVRKFLSLICPIRVEEAE